MELKSFINTNGVKIELTPDYITLSYIYDNGNKIKLEYKNETEFTKLTGHNLYSINAVSLYNIYINLK